MMQHMDQIRSPKPLSKFDALTFPQLEQCRKLRVVGYNDQDALSTQTVVSGVLYTFIKND